MLYFLAYSNSYLCVFVDDQLPCQLLLRQKIIDVYKREEISQRQLAQRFNVALSFIVKLLRQYRTTGNISPKPFNGGVKLKLDPENLAVLAELIESNNDATLDELCQMLKDRSGVSISRATMARMTQRLQLSVKKTLHPDEKHTERVQKLRLAFWAKIRNIPIKDLVFLDEAGVKLARSLGEETSPGSLVNLALIRLYARAPRGHRARGSRPHKRGKNVSMINAISLKGIVTSINLLGSIDGLTNERLCDSQTSTKTLEGCSSSLG